MRADENEPALPNIDVLPNEKLSADFGGSDDAGLPNMFLPLLNENVGAVTTAASLLLVLKLNLPNGVVFVSFVFSVLGADLVVFAFVNELKENVELVTDDDDVVVSFDKLLLGT